MLIGMCPHRAIIGSIGDAYDLTTEGDVIGICRARVVMEATEEEFIAQEIARKGRRPETMSGAFYYWIVMD